MAISYQHLKQRPFEPVRQHYGERDTMLYALSLGLGSDPLCADALPFFYEGAPGGLRARVVVLGVRVFELVSHVPVGLIPLLALGVRLQMGPVG
jgi:hypothetical protein